MFLFMFATGGTCNDGNSPVCNLSIFLCFATFDLSVDGEQPVGGLQEPLHGHCQCGICDGADHHLLPLPILENQDGRDASDAVTRRDVPVLVSVELEAP